MAKKQTEYFIQIDGECIGTYERTEIEDGEGDVEEGKWYRVTEMEEVTITRNGLTITKKTK